MFLREPRVTVHTPVREMKDNRGPPHQRAKTESKMYHYQVG